MILRTSLIEISKKLGVNPKLLWSLIKFESNWNPQARNPLSSAGGLIQFIDDTSRGLGFKNTNDLLIKLPDIDSQLKYAVYPYLKQYAPFPTAQSLFMAVFYPDARYWPETKVFPQKVLNYNPGIKTPLDYMNFVYKKLNLRYVPNVIFLGIGFITLYLLLKGRK